MSAPRWEYRVWSLQLGKVLWDNGAWTGRVAVNKGSEKEMLESCPAVWDYLNAAGAEGWELVSATPSTVTRQGAHEPIASSLFLKRTR